MSVGTNIQTINFNKPVQQNVQMTFRSQTVPVKDYPPDTVEINGKKKGLSKGAKVGIGLGLLGTVALAIGLIAKGKGSQAKQLAEHIDFKEAQTLKDAIKFGKEKLGIKKYSGFKEEDLEILNYYNNGLTEISNKFKGKAELPDKIVATLFKDSYANGDTIMAGMDMATETLHINIDTCRNLRNEMKRYYEELVANGWITKEGKFIHEKLLTPEDSKFFENAIQGYNRGNCDFTQLNRFDYAEFKFTKCIDDMFSKPDVLIKKMLDNPENVQLFEKEKFPTDFERIKTMSIEEQSSLAKKMVGKAGIPRFRDNMDYENIFHEEMHLLDKLNLEKRPASIYKYNLDYTQYPSELKAWVDNKEYQRIANQISKYAASGPNEFIAEYGSTVLRGNSVSKEATDLYKKLNGPELNL